MKVAIVGSRDYPDLAAVRHFVQALAAKYPDAIVISGAARGVDSVATAEARAVGLTVQEFPADWDRLGRRAGYARNEQIVQAADRIVAFWDGSSRGTQHTLSIARAAGKPVHLFTPENRRA